MIKDLLWACVVCGAEESLRPEQAEKRRGREVCRQCGAIYQRGAGANIVVTKPGGEPLEKTPREWSAMLPKAQPGGSARCTARIADDDKPIRTFGEYWGRYEHFGAPSDGTLTLTTERLTFAPDDPGRRGFDWVLLDLTAIQLSSSTLQLKAKQHPVVTLRFHTSSSKLWEERLQEAVRAAYARVGKGDVVEFQPRIVTASR